MEGTDIFPFMLTCQILDSCGRQLQQSQRFLSGKLAGEEPGCGETDVAMK